MYFFYWNYINKSNDGVYATFTSAKRLNACHRFNTKCLTHLIWIEARDFEFCIVLLFFLSLSLFLSFTLSFCPTLFLSSSLFRQTAKIVSFEIFFHFHPIPLSWSLRSNYFGFLHHLLHSENWSINEFVRWLCVMISFSIRF